MQDCALLEQIWSEAIEARPPEAMSPLARLLGALLTVPVVTLVSHADGDRPHALMESDELLPGASLGDVLAEELGLDVPRDAVVLIEPVAFADAEAFSGAALGEELGRVLSDIASCAGAPLLRHAAAPSGLASTVRAAPRTMTRDFARILPETEAPTRQGGAWAR